VRVYINFVYADRDMTDSNLYIGWDSGSTTSYWDRINRFTYRASGDFITEMVGRTGQVLTQDNGTNTDLVMYMNTDLASPANSISVHLWYNSIERPY